ncbi:MAG TPA: sodium:proton symporter, partial [Afifellaceae bacterium]|nr:sodium:proton symporter [Afifellaceae bacterium]
SLLAGLLLPQLAVLARPLLAPAVFTLLVVAFIRVPRDRLLDAVRRPALSLMAVLWIMLAVPAAFAVALYGFGIAEAAPGLALGVFLMLIAPPVVSSPAFAGLIGLNAFHSLAILVIAMIITPLTAPLFVAVVLDQSVSLDPRTIGARLFWLMAGAAIAAALVRRFVGWQRIVASGDLLDGTNVVVLFVFIVALMGDTAYRFIEDPMRITLIVGLTFALAGLILGVTALVLVRSGRAEALTAALAASNRNMGLMPAAVGASLPPDTWLWFALAQFPIYLLPAIIKPFVPNLTGKRPGPDPA